MNYKEILNELYSRPEWKFRLGLRNMKILLKNMGNPERKLKCIHVAGTNGKGSVCAMLSSILQDAGYKVGMYTSPHLKKFNERIRINDKLISDKDVAKYYLRVKKHVTNQSFFEITTAMAFLYFLDNNADIVVLEVGMGGRLDSTNLVRPLVSVITNIGYEHTNRLGKTLDKIAYEKSGIIKRNVPVVTGAKGVASAAIRKIANERNSKVYAISHNPIKNRYYDKKNNCWVFSFDGNKNIVLNNLKGKFQQQNALIAKTTLEILDNNKDIKINNKNIIDGLKKAKWLGRFQYLSKKTIIDSAHNPEGFKVLFGELKNIDYDKLVLVAGFSRDKDVKKISAIIKQNKKIKKIILTQANNERAMPIEEAIKYFKKDNNLKVINNSKKALKFAKEITKNKDLILIAGSIYLVGELI